MTFAVPMNFYRRCSEDGRLFRCPNPSCAWPEQRYTKSAVQKLKAELERERGRADRAVEARRWADKAREREERSHAATKGHLTRARKRAGAGVCPCCKRSFKQLREHMKAKHPNYDPAKLPE